jgi:class 3 adenylate cyclase/tetratricopeptide (TPR) repeat protein
VDIGTWLRTIGLDQYEQVFRDNAVDDDTIFDLTDTDLASLGIRPLGHRKKLLQAIAALESGVSGRAPTAHQPEGVADSDPARRLIAVLFADLVGSMELAGRVDPEELRAILGGYRTCCSSLVQQFDGAVAQYQGDGIIAHFGHPRAHEDDARRAVCCGLAIANEIPGLRLSPGVNLAVRVGIATGLVVVGDQAGKGPAADGVAFGNAPNIAARLQSLADPGDVIIERNTRRLLADTIELVDLGARTVKGIEQPLLLWRAVREKSVGRNPTPRVPFVGRRLELQQCQKLIAACRRIQRGQVVYVRGEAGIGKTRFVEEVMHLANAEGFACHRGVMLDFGTGRGEDPVRTVLCSLLGIDPGGEEEARRVVAESAVAAGLLPTDHLVFLQDLLGVPQSTDMRGLYDAMDNDSRNRGKREVLPTLVTRLSEQHGQIIIFEDLHWCDSSTLSFLTALASGVVGRQILLVLTSRPDGDRLDAAWRATVGEDQLTTIDLGPLGLDEATGLASTFGDAPNSVARRCIERANGNPLFLEQLMRNAEEGIDEAIPASIHALIAARMDRLPATDRRTLQVASVFGQRFGLEALGNLLEWRECSCHSLAAAGFLRLDGAAYRFVHVLIRDAVYDTLLMSRRRDLHRRAAVWFADRGDLVLRAQHLDRAEAPEAARAHLEAAQALRAAYQYEAALRLIERGIAVAREAADRSALICCKGRILHDLGAIEDARRAYEDALAAAAGDVERCRAWIGLAAVKRITDDLAGASDDLDRAEQAATRSGTLLAERARIHYLRGNLCFPRGDMAGCLREHTRSLDLARQAGAAELEATALGGLGDSEYMVGRMLSAQHYFQQCVEICQRHGFGRIEVANRPMAAFTRWFAGDVRGGLAEAMDAIGAAAKVGHARAEIIAHHAAYFCRHALTDFASAWDNAARALTLARQLGARRFEAEALAFQGELHRLAGRRSQALADLKQAIAIFRETGMAFMGPMVLGMVALATEEPDERNSALAEAEALLTGGVVAHNHLLFRKDAIDACLAVSAWDQAEHHAAALEDFTRQEPTPWGEFFVARGLALSACGRGRRDLGLVTELRRLRDEGERLGLLQPTLAIERALSTRGNSQLSLDQPTGRAGGSELG